MDLPSQREAGLWTKMESVVENADLRLLWLDFKWAKGSL